MTPTALLDGDIIAYQAAARCQKDGNWDGTQPPTFDEEEVREDIARTIRKWTWMAGARDNVVLITGETNFRKLVEPTYKSNRVDKAKPVGLQFARRMLVELHDAKMVEGLEADDLMGLMLTGSMAGGRGVCVSIDKDLRTIPGLHLNPNKGGVFRVSPAQADHWWMTQTLTGDTVDGYTGCDGMGPERAEALLARGHVLVPVSRTLKSGPRKGLSVVEWKEGPKGKPWAVVASAFLRKGLTEKDAIKQARLARILRTGDYDKASKEVILWHPTSPSRLTLPSGSPRSLSSSGPEASAAA